MKQPKAAKGKRDKYVIDPTEANPEVIKIIVGEFEYLAQKKRILTIEEDKYVLKSGAFKAEKKGDLSVSHPTVRKFAKYMFYLKHNQIELAKDLNLNFPETFCTCWKLATNNTWEYWVERHIGSNLLDPKADHNYSYQPRFSNGIDLIEKAVYSGIVHSESPAFFIGAFCSYIWAEHWEKLLNYVIKNQYQVRILGQNPDSERAANIAESLGTDVDTFGKIKETCFNLEAEAPHLIRVNFDYDIDDYFYQGIFSETNKHNISFKLFIRRELAIDESGAYEIQNNQHIKGYGDVFARIRKLYRKDAWKLPVKEYVS